MKVTLNPPCMVKPAEPTWSGRLALSELDQTGMNIHVPTIYFYSKPSLNWNTLIQTLKTSLATTLVHFYPLAGRLSTIVGGRLELNCNAHGVQFTEAHADVNLVDLDGFLNSSISYDLITSVDYRHASIEETPLLLLQVTRFVCGGWSLGFCISHVVVDGHGALHFLSEWARVCRGGPVGPPPYLDRKCLRAGELPLTTTACLSSERFGQFGTPPILLGQSSNRNERRKKTTVTMLKLSETLVETLRMKANESRKTGSDIRFTRYEVVTAHIWQTACRVRKLEPTQPTAIDICVDVRSRMRPPLPEKYFGNAIVDVIATGTSVEIVSESLGYVSSKIRDAIKKVDDEYVNSVIDFLKNQQDLSKFQDLHQIREGEGPFYGNPNLGVFSWLTLPLDGVDFGWGEEVFTGPVQTDDGDFLILRGKEGSSGSVIVSLCLQERHTEDFKRVFYQTIEG